jgi:hypothetical protein
VGAILDTEKTRLCFAARKDEARTGLPIGFSLVPLLTMRHICAWIFAPLVAVVAMHSQENIATNPVDNNEDAQISRIVANQDASVGLPRQVAADFPRQNHDFTPPKFGQYARPDDSPYYNVDMQWNGDSVPIFVRPYRRPSSSESDETRVQPKSIIASNKSIREKKSVSWSPNLDAQYRWIPLRRDRLLMENDDSAPKWRAFLDDDEPTSPRDTDVDAFLDGADDADPANVLFVAAPTPYIPPYKRRLIGVK